MKTIRRHCFYAAICIGCLLTGCAQTGTTKEAAENEITDNEAVSESADNEAAVSESTDNEAAASEGADNEAAVSESADNEVTASESVDDNETANEALESENLENENTEIEQRNILIENPGEEYYFCTEKQEKENILTETISLELLSETENQIIDTQEWFEENQLEKVPEGYINFIEDESYYYQIIGDDGYSGYMLLVYDKESDEALYCLDFSEYRYASVYKKEDKDFIEQRIWWAQAIDNVLYVAIGHNTYTESSPYTGYLTAIDMNDWQVIWKSAPCISNARMFSVIGETIVSGYGFTSEPDYLYLVNRYNGEVLEQIPIKSMADYIIEKEDKLYVRTYNTNYEFQIVPTAIDNERH